MAFESRPQLLRNFVQKRASHDEEQDADMVNGIHPDWLRVHRVIAKKQTVRDTQFLTKWCSSRAPFCNMPGAPPRILINVPAELAIRHQTLTDTLLARSSWQTHARWPPQTIVLWHETAVQSWQCLFYMHDPKSA